MKCLTLSSIPKSNRLLIICICKQVLPFLFFLEGHRFHKISNHRTVTRLDCASLLFSHNTNMLFPNNVSLHVLKFIWAAPPRQKSIKRHWRQSGRHVCRGQSCSPLKKNRRGVKHAHCLCSSSVHTEGGWWWFAVENHRHTRFLTDGRPATTGSGKLYFNTD